MEIALDIEDMNAKAIVFNTVTINGDILVYPVKINHVGLYEERKTRAIETNVVHDRATVEFYFDSTNSTSTFPYVDEEQYTPNQSWTLKEGDYILCVGKNAEFPDVSNISTYGDLMSFMENNKVYQIGRVYSVRDEVGDIIMRSVECPA